MAARLGPPRLPSQRLAPAAGPGAACRCPGPLRTLGPAARPPGRGTERQSGAGAEPASLSKRTMRG
eukprot:768392-Hanusia_phi.AAC.20